MSTVEVGGRRGAGGVDGKEGVGGGLNGVEVGGKGVG